MDILPVEIDSVAIQLHAANSVFVNPLDVLRGRDKGSDHTLVRIKLSA